MSGGNKNKADGTEWERIFKEYMTEGLDEPWTVKRLPEEGIYDEGDIEIENARTGHRFIVECKSRERLNIFTTMAKAAHKAKSGTVVLAWRQRIKKPGNQRRSQVYPPLVVMDLELFRHLISEYRRNG